MRFRVLTLATLMVGAGCAGDGPTSEVSAAAACPLDDAAPTVELRLRHSTGWFAPQVDDLFTRFDDTQAGVRIVPEPVELPEIGVAADLLEGTGAPLSLVSRENLASLVRAGAVTSLEPCIEASGDEMSGFLPAALAAGQVDGRQYGLPANVHTWVMLYDRGAFARAGLDPDDPPATLAELLDAGRALRDRGGVAHPIAWPQPVLAYLASGLGLVHDRLPITSDERAEPVTAAIEALGAEGLLLDDGEGPMLPLGDGRATILMGHNGHVWSLGKALADGQSPGTELGVAPVPGLAGPGSPVLGQVWVVASSASPAERAAAWRFLQWIEEPAQQAELAVLSDYWPSRPAAVEEPALREYWAGIPLFRAAWDAFVSAPVVLAGDAVEEPAHWPLNEALVASARTGRADGIDAATERSARILATLEERPAEILRCLVAALHDGGQADSCLPSG
jgi:sn-glycerol 3-phosphate transport system substrate-binding protein